ncbi:MAG: hypothetical protein ABI550_01195, partial [Ignavibacteriaceae bacterium]
MKKIRLLPYLISIIFLFANCNKNSNPLQNNNYSLPDTSKIAIVSVYPDRGFAGQKIYLTGLRKNDSLVWS